MPLHVAFLIKLLVVSWHQFMDFSTQDQLQIAKEKCKVTTQPCSQISQMQRWVCSCYTGSNMTSLLNTCASVWTMLSARYGKMLLSKCSNVVPMEMDPSS